MRSVLFLVVFLASIGCQSDGSGNGRAVNPNGDSELALLMREMFDDGMRTKAQILNGELPEIRSNYKHMFNAEATEPDKVASIDYELFGKAYEATVRNLLEADEAHRADAYQTMVGACLNCHQAMCPGPMVKIKKMYLSEAQLESVSPTGVR